MTEDQKKLLLKALDALWGGLDSAHDVAAMLLDSQDGRIENMSEALCESQDAILALKESFGVDKF